MSTRPAALLLGPRPPGRGEARMALPDEPQPSCVAQSSCDAASPRAPAEERYPAKHQARSWVRYRAGRAPYRTLPPRTPTPAPPNRRKVERWMVPTSTPFDFSKTRIAAFQANSMPQGALFVLPSTTRANRSSSKTQAQSARVGVPQQERSANDEYHKSPDAGRLHCSVPQPGHGDG